MNSIRMTAGQFKAARDGVLAGGDEAAAFLVAGCFANNNGIHFTVRRVVVPEPADCDSRSPRGPAVSPAFFNRATSMAEASNATIIQCCSHPSPKESPRYSEFGCGGEEASAETVHSRLGKPMGNMLFGPKGVAGRAWLPGASLPEDIGELRLVDRHLEIRDIGGAWNKTRVDEAVFDRQIRAFGLKGQLLLSRLRVGIVGAGGTGSAVAEQLAREGVRDITIADHDRFEPSNVTRIYGSRGDTGRDYKVDIVSRHIRGIQGGCRVRAIPRTILSLETLSHFKDCDVVFGCTDRHTPRSVLNELAHQYFIPVIDAGVGIDAKGGKIAGGTVRASLTSPSIPCLFCSGIINPERILAESLGATDLAARQKEGYVRGADGDAPSVIALTTMAASYAVLLLKDLLFNLMDGHANTLALDIASFSTSRIASPVRKDCACALRMGLADGFPLSAA